MVDPESHGSSQLAQDASTDNEELFAIIDETGEGFGFEITPEALMKPIAIASSVLFGVGMLAGVPLGVAMGRADDGDGKGVKGKKAKPTMGGLKFAATTFGLGTLLCGAMGTAGFYAVKWHYGVESFEEFGVVMKEVIPMRRRNMESNLAPVLDVVRKNAGDSLPAPMRRLQERFQESRFGTWMRDKVDFSTIIEDETDTEFDNGNATHSTHPK